MYLLIKKHEICFINSFKHEYNSLAVVLAKTKRNCLQTIARHKKRQDPFKTQLSFIFFKWQRKFQTYVKAKNSVDKANRQKSLRERVY